MTILLAEDSPVYRHLITGHLNEWSFDFVCAKDGRAAWDLLTKPDAPRLALLDWVLPGLDGVELCRRLRHRPETEPYTYAILLTAKSQKHEMLEAMDAGADDFLARPFDPPELKARLQVGKRIVELQQKLVSANEALHYAASHDFLTRLWNRAAIIAFLQREMARSLREGRALGVILVDIDHFKKVNDELGHENGRLRAPGDCEAIFHQSARIRWNRSLWRRRVSAGHARLRPRNNITSSQSHQRVDFEHADPDSCQANNGDGQHGGYRRGVGY